MHRSKIGKILLPVLLVLLLSTSSFIFASPMPQIQLLPFDFPRLDDLFFVLAYPRAYSLEKAKACEIDNFVGAVQTGDINTLTGPPYNWAISMQPGFHMCYIGPNCRDVTPSSSGADWNYHGRTPGFKLYPINVSQFRMALEIIVSGFKDAWLAAIYGYINVRIDQTVPPANAYWFNPCITYYPSDWAIAENLLLGAGFTWSYGSDATPHTADDKWTCPDGMVLWDGSRASQPKSDRYAGYLSAPGEDIYGIWVMPPGNGIAPTSYQITMNHVDKWNLFFCGVEAHPTGASPDRLLFIDDATDNYDQLILVTFYNRDHDFYMLCWGLGRNPDYLYDFFSPEVDIEGGDNSPGLNHPGLSRVLRTVKYWKFKDWELLASNVGPPCDPEYLIPASSTFGPYRGFAAVVTPVQVEIERIDLALGVYDEELVEGVDYTVSWTKNAITNLWEVTIHLLNPVTLYLGEALEAKFPALTYHRVITDITEMRTVVYLAQWKLYYLLPYLPVYSRNYINLYKPGVTCWVNSKGFGSDPSGSDMPWSYNSLHWEGEPVGGSMNYHDAGAVSTLNPITASWVYEINVLGRIYEAAWVVDPYTHEDRPWIACKWKMIPWVDLAEHVDNGMIIKLWLRNDVYWQDGDPVTAQDIAWNFDFIESLTPPEYIPIWQGLIKTQIVNDYLIELFINATGLWKFYEFAGTILQFPKPAWEDYMGDYNPATTADYDAAVAYSPWEVLRNTKPGNLGPADLTMLYGTGPFYFQWWDTTIGLGVIKAKALKTPPLDYWARAASLPNGQLPQIYVEGQCSKLYLDVLTPKIIHTFLDIEIFNIDSKEPCEYTWTLMMDGTVAIATGVGALDPIKVNLTKVVLPWTTIAPCIHTFTLTVTNAAGTTTYTITAAVTFADLNCDCKVDIKDLVLLIKAFGSTPASIKWNENGDVNGDGKVDIKDLVILIKNFGKFCGA